MALNRRELLLGVAAVLSAPQRSAAGEADVLAVIVHPENPSTQLGLDAIEPIFTTTRRFWDDRGPIVAFNLPPHSVPRIEFDRVILRMDPELVGRFWIDRRVRGGQPPPRVAPDPVTVVSIVANLKNAIGYVPMSSVTPNVRVIARVRRELLPP